MVDTFWDFYDYLLLDNDFNIAILVIWMIVIMLLAVFCGLFYKKLGRKRIYSVFELFMYNSVAVILSSMFKWWFAAILCVPLFFLRKFIEKLGWEAYVATKWIDGDVKDLMLSNRVIIPSMVLTYLITQLILYIASYNEIVLF